MEFKFVLRKEKVVGEKGDKYLMKSSKKEITRKQAEELLKKGKWGGFKQLAFWYEKGKFCYGQKKLKTFDALLHSIEKDSKRNKVTLMIENEYRCSL